MGNHDGIEQFVKPLDSLAEKYSNFSWHPAYITIHEALFLHGDIPVRSKGVLLLERKLIKQKKLKGSFINIFYSLFTNSGMLKYYRLIHNKSKTRNSLSTTISNHKNSFNQEIKSVYFGHTHIPYNNFQFNGLVLNNLGSAIKHLPFNMTAIQLICD